MPNRGVGRCERWNRCSLARAGADIPVTGGAWVCPECASQLTVVKAGGGLSMSPTLLIIPVAAAAIIGLAIFLHGSRRIALETAGSRASTVARVTKPTPPAQRTADTAASNVILRLVGSNTIGSSLAPKLAAAFLKSRGDDPVSVSVAENQVDFRVDGNHAGYREEITIAAHKSQEAFDGLAKGIADIGMASRPIKDAEIELLRTLGDMTAPDSEHVIGLDGIAIIVSPSNPVTRLTTDQIGAAFSGIVHDWSNLGAPPGPIHVYSRPDGSGTYEIFKSKILGDTALLRADATRIEDSHKLSLAVAADSSGIGFIGLPYVGTAKALPIAAVGRTYLAPTPFTVATENYYLARRLYLYTGEHVTNPQVSAFVAFALSQAGQAIVENTGFIPLTVRPEAADPPAEASARFRYLIKGTLRLSTTFRFATGAAKLDSRAVQDTYNLSDFLSSSHIDASRVLLVGFTDDQGDSRMNLALAKQRAASVASALSTRNLQGLQQFGFGAEMPVANNATEDGRRLNRRVEVYVTR